MPDMTNNSPGGMTFWDATKNFWSGVFTGSGVYDTGGSVPANQLDAPLIVSWPDFFWNYGTGRLSQDEANQLAQMNAAGQALAKARPLTQSEIQDSYKSTLSFIDNYEGGTAQNYVSSFVPDFGTLGFPSATTLLVVGIVILLLVLILGRR